MGWHFWKTIKRYEWRYHNIILLSASVIAAYYIMRNEVAQELISGLGDLGYIGAFFGGLLFSYGLTTAPAFAILFLLGKSLNPIVIALIGAMGSVVSDYIIFKFVRDRLSRDIMFLLKDLGIRLHILKVHRWKSLVPILAGFIIASPLPDELALALLGGVHFDTRKFIAYAYAFNAIGIFFIAAAGGGWT